MVSSIQARMHRNRYVSKSSGRLHADRDHRNTMTLKVGGVHSLDVSRPVRMSAFVAVS